MSDDALQEPEQDWDGKTFGEAAAEDQDEADRLVEETGDESEAAERFDSSEGDVGQTPTS
jgi:hypothetical protein